MAFLDAALYAVLSHGVAEFQQRRTGRNACATGGEGFRLSAILCARDFVEYGEGRLELTPGQAGAQHAAPLQRRLPQKAAATEEMSDGDDDGQRDTGKVSRVF